jgi:hypothetical protein
MSIVCIGDVHGHTDRYKKMLQKRFADRRTLQVGDMGFGFSRNPDGMSPMPANHRWIRGNHDKPDLCRRHPNYLGDYGYLPEDSLFYLAGAFSIDRAFRIEGQSWWADEELSWPELQQAIDLYKEKKPRFVVSHDAPSEAATQLLIVIAGGFRPEKLDGVQSRTAQALQVMFDFHQPKEWVFGHYHIDKSFDWKGTKFTCVNELSTYELETENG